MATTNPHDVQQSYCTPSVGLPATDFREIADSAAGSVSVALSPCALCGGARDPLTRLCQNQSCPAPSHNRYLELEMGCCPGCGGPYVPYAHMAPCAHSFHIAPREHYLQWGYAGGPKECEHGRAAGIACPGCDRGTFLLNLHSAGPCASAENPATQGVMDVPGTGVGSTRPPRASSPSGPGAIAPSPAVSAPPTSRQMLQVIADLVIFAQPVNWDDVDPEFLKQTAREHEAWIAAHDVIAKWSEFAGCDAQPSVVSPAAPPSAGMLGDKERVLAWMRRNGYQVLTGAELAEELGQEVARDEEIAKGWGSL